jgi:pimeloyl-ACP methyl ester carboxylesterase
MGPWGTFFIFALFSPSHITSGIRTICSKSVLRYASRWIPSDLTFGPSTTLPSNYYLTPFIQYSGNHESGGQWKQSGFAQDVQDLVTVVAYLRSTYGYEIDVVVGHSRGSVVGMHWLCTSEEGQHARAMVNASGRYRMHVREIIFPCVERYLK